MQPICIHWAPSRKILAVFFTTLQRKPAVCIQCLASLSGDAHLCVDVLVNLRFLYFSSGCAFCLHVIKNLRLSSSLFHSKLFDNSEPNRNNKEKKSLANQITIFTFFFFADIASPINCTISVSPASSAVTYCSPSFSSFNDWGFDFKLTTLSYRSHLRSTTTCFLH